MAAIVSEGCRVSRKPWRKLWCRDDNSALSTHKAHQLRLLSRDSSLHKAVKLLNNWVLIQTKARQGQSITSSLTVLCMAINIHRRQTVRAAGLGEANEGLPQSHSSPFFFLFHAFLLSFPCSFALSLLTWCDNPPADPLSGSGAQRRRGLPDVTGGVNRASWFSHKEPGTKRKGGCKAVYVHVLVMALETELQVVSCCYATTYDSRFSAITADIQKEDTQKEDHSKCAELVRLLKKRGGQTLVHVSWSLKTTDCI